MATYEEVVAHTLEQILIRKRKDQILAELTQAGITEMDAEAIFAEAMSVKVSHFKAQGQKRLGWGSLGFGVGLVLTLFGAAQGGSFIVFSGLMAVGGVYALVGLVQSATGWKIT